MSDLNSERVAPRLVMCCTDCDYSTEVVYDAAAHNYAHDEGHHMIGRVEPEMHHNDGPKEAEVNE